MPWNKMDVSMKWTTYLDFTLYDLTIRYVHDFFCINNGTHHHEKIALFHPTYSTWTATWSIKNSVSGNNDLLVKIEGPGAG